MGDGAEVRRRVISPLFGAAARAALAIATAPLAIACSAPVAHVTQGAAFVTGNSDYDQFFSDVNDVRIEAGNAESDARSTHARLASTLRVDPSGPPTLTLDEAEKRSRKLHD